MTITKEELITIVGYQLKELHEDLNFIIKGWNKKTNSALVEIKVYNCDGDWTILPY